jgi:hypothetical protein
VRLCVPERRTRSRARAHTGNTRGTYTTLIWPCGRLVSVHTMSLIFHSSSGTSCIASYFARTCRTDHRSTCLEQFDPHVGYGHGETRIEPHATHLRSTARSHAHCTRATTTQWRTSARSTECCEAAHLMTRQRHTNSSDRTSSAIKIAFGRTICTRSDQLTAPACTQSTNLGDLRRECEVGDGVAVDARLVEEVACVLRSTQHVITYTHTCIARTSPWCR